MNAKIHLIVAARPNFMKAAPLYLALKEEAWCTPILVHTGQHYDEEMSQAFLNDLGLPKPDHHLGVGSGSHAEQTAGVMVAYEKICREHKPDWIVVMGDVNSTLAAALAAKKLNLPVAHLEAGLRSGDRTMPEEINRLVTDAISDLLWTPSEDADDNLRREGIPESRIKRVGNIMIDSYEMLLPKIEAAGAAAEIGLEPGTFGVVTLHRPSNVDSPETLKALVGRIVEIARRVPLVFPVHPRTRQRLEAFSLWNDLSERSEVRVTGPLSYLRFMSLVRDSRFVITDSGGLQEETTYLHIPCLTVRDTTERPITVDQGTNRLARTETLVQLVDEILGGRWPRGRRPELWDGRTAARVADSLRQALDCAPQRPSVAGIGSTSGHNATT